MTRQPPAHDPQNEVFGADLGSADLPLDASSLERPAVQRRLMNKAVHYLGRHSASQQRLREVLGRFALRKLGHFEPAEIQDAISLVVADCQRLGYVDDAAFAMSQARSKRRSGKSALAIRRGLQQHAIDDELVAEALGRADEDLSDGELGAALRHAERRRLGPYHKSQMDDAKRQRHLASLARAGFALGIARRIMDLADREAAEELAYQLRDLP